MATPHSSLDGSLIAKGMCARKARFTGTYGAFSGSSTARSASDTRSSLSVSERALHVAMPTGWRQVVALLS